MKKMKKTILILAVVLFVLSIASAVLAAKNIEIENNTGIVVAEIYLSGSGTNDWEEDILGNEVLNPGEVWGITISGPYPEWDLKLVGETGAEAIFYNINFNRYTRVTLNSDGSANGR